MGATRLCLLLALGLSLSACGLIPQQPTTEPGPTPSPRAAHDTPQEPPLVQASAEDALTVAATPPPPPAPVDLWERMRRGFELPELSHPRIAQELRAFSGKQGYFDRVAERAEPYLYFILEELEARDMPLDLALLPIVESAFRPFAYSPGRAAGLWQFIPATGRHYGLKQTWWYDGRRDVIASTRAALNYLDHLHGLFGDWALALAAYNAGQGTVRGAIRRNAAAGKPTDYFSLPLPRETRAYVPRLLALREIVRNPAAHDLSLHSLPDEPYIEVVEIDGQIDLALAAEMAQLSLEEIYRLNPGFNRWATDPEGPHYLVLPAEHADRFRQAWAEQPAEGRVQWTRHRVNPGETLSHIARQYRTTSTVLRQANQLNGHIIRAGAYLLVPTARQGADSYVLSASQRRVRLQQADRAGQRMEVLVRRGDSFWKIARQHGVSVDRLAAWNGLSPRDTLRPGQRLVLWKKGGSSAGGPASRTQRIHYTVRSGDSLYLIARKFSVSVKQLRSWNALNGKYLQPGQRLVLHVDVTRQGG
ncbi:LysM peptidoglycan-binding domain-containing protein [Alkalilimnicola sp. S0819]|uniref:LysM peptidoglycan-binding domain-containing protein n=1 Tax=Alkalilimnicola sp. S0819 TaxID=2613922 RepID=UPI00126217C4|nr:LysM peptidoglycan-binding domain-containing protein [Alkalilimnicola sp. S0819]KAB7622553.1 LysM peptidoglycan-binding domain-containing protein [Alkalilimnicola sp. S0819]MPQ17440.1 LysM peptidoglycan-binding domain-containing protein [Alkalilimnicola sp. S0819]